MLGVAVLGVDVSRAMLATSLLDPLSRTALWQAQCPNTLTGIRSLLKTTPQDVPIVLEPTGRCGQLVVREARAAGRQVLLAEPRRAKAFLRSVQSRARTDKLDSVGLALFALSSRCRLTRSKARWRKSWINCCLLARALPPRWRAWSSRPTSCPMPRRRSSQLYRHFERSGTGWTRRLKSLRAPGTRAGRAARWPKPPKPFCGCPGTRLRVIGPVTAAALASRLCSRAFCHADQFVAYIGLDIRVIQSGRKRGQRGLTKQGDAELRRLLFNCARAATLAKGSPSRGHYERERAKGLEPDGGALCCRPQAGAPVVVAGQTRRQL
jgi:hypothetical protein